MTTPATRPGAHPPKTESSCDMTWWHIILIGGSGAAILAIAAIRVLRRPISPSDITGAPEAELDRRVKTTLTRGRNTFII